MSAVLVDTWWGSVDRIFQDLSEASYYGAGRFCRMSRKVRARRGTVVGLAGVFVLGLLFGGCVITYNGSRLEMNLSLGTGMQTSDIVVPTPGKRPGDAGYFSHYELFANIEDSGLVRLGVFLVRPVFATDNPCVQFLPDTFCRPGGQACPEYINPERFSVLEQIYGVVSAPTAATTEDASNPYGYDFSVGFDFMQWPDDLFQDPSLQDPAEKLARANLKQDAVEQFCSNLPPGYYVGNPALLAQPLHGDLFGPVDGADPRTGIQLGGITPLAPDRKKDIASLAFRALIGGAFASWMTATVAGMFL